MEAQYDVDGEPVGLAQKWIEYEGDNENHLVIIRGSLTFYNQASRDAKRGVYPVEWSEEKTPYSNPKEMLEKFKNQTTNLAVGVVQPRKLFNVIVMTIGRINVCTD